MTNENQNNYLQNIVIKESIEKDFYPYIPLILNELPLRFKRLQFVVNLAYSMITMNWDCKNMGFK